MKAFLKIALLLAVLGATAYGSMQAVQDREAKKTAAQGDAAKGGPGGGGGAPIAAEGVRAVPEKFEFPIAAVGVLSPNESVEVTSEQQRRLKAVHVAEGQKVNAGDLLFELDEADLVADLKELKARLEFAKSREARLREALATSVASKTEYDSAKADLSVLEAQIERTEIEIAKTRIRAPFAGHAGLRRTSVGAWLTPSTPLITLQDRSRLKVDFKVPERHAASIAPGQEFRFRPDGSGQWFDGKVVAIEASIEPETRSLVVRGEAPNPGEVLIPGAFVSVELVARSWDDAILVPTQAVMPTGRGNALFVEKDGKAERRNVELGQRTADRVQVVKGIAPGEVVLVSNLLRLRPGAAVKATLVEGER